MVIGTWWRLDDSTPMIQATPLRFILRFILYLHQPRLSGWGSSLLSHIIMDWFPHLICDL